MEDLILKHFGFLINNNKNNLQHIIIKAGWSEEYYLKSPNCIICVGIDYKDDDAYLSIGKETERFNNEFLLKHCFTNFQEHAILYA